MEYLIGFTIAVFIAITGVGAGTITTPLLILFLGVPASVAVSTGLMFSSAVKLVLVPSQIARGNVNWRVLALHAGLAACRVCCWARCCCGTWIRTGRRRC